MADARQINEDFDKANSRISYYSDRIHSIATVKSECFTTAKSSFQDFLQLKDEQDSIMKYSGIILLAASLVLPEIGLGLALAKSATKAKQFAEQLEKVEQLEKNLEKVKKGLEYVEKARAKDELKTKKKEEKEVSEQREKVIGTFENSLKIVKEDNELLLKSDELLEFVRDQIIGYKYYYLDTLNRYANGDLYNIADSILSGTDIKLGEDEIDQIAKSYLYELIKSYCISYPPITFVHQLGDSQGFYEIDGLNDTQQKWIFDNFGIGAARGKYFMVPYVFSVQQTLLNWGVKPGNKTTSPPMRYRH